MDSTKFRKKPEGLPEIKPVDFKMVNEPLERLYNTFVPLLEKEPPKPPTLFFIKYILTTSYETYKVMCGLVSDNEKKKYPIQAHILSRSVIDAAVVVMALVDNPDNYHKYELSGYKEAYEEYEEEIKRYCNDLNATAYLNEKKTTLDSLSKILELSPEEISDPSHNIKYWPIPSKFLIKNPQIRLSPERESFLKEIYKWNYKQPSGLSHLSWRGVAMSVFASLPQYHWDPGKYESDAIYIAQLFLLIILSEIEIYKIYGCSQDLRYLWTFLGEYYEEVKDYYHMRYKKLLPL